MRIWLKFPGLFYGIALASGIGAFYGYFFPLIIGFTADRKTRLLGFYLLAALALVEIHLFSTKSPPEEMGEVVGYYQIQKVQKSKSPIYRGFNYQGVLKSFILDGTPYNNALCYVSIKSEAIRPVANVDYIVEGRLDPIGSNRYFMTVHKWTPVPNTFSLAEKRLELKNKLRTYLKKEIPDKEVYWLFASLATGEIENPILSEAFRRVGLSHLLAISGLHYSFLIVSLSAFFSLFLSRKVSTCLLLVIVSLYFYFIGETPSLNRAWMASNIFLIGSLLNRKSSGLNALGIALLFSLILDPFCITSLGFQLSYLATFAILAFYPSINELLGHIFLIRSYKTALQLSFFEKHIFIIGSYLRRSSALTLSVSLAIFPLMMLRFGSFPIASILYNLLVPITITVTLLTLVFGMAIPFILQLGAFYSRIWMDFVLFGWSDIPVIVGKFFSNESVVDYLVALVLIGTYLEFRRYELTIIARRR